MKQWINVVHKASGAYIKVHQMGAGSSVFETPNGEHLSIEHLDFTNASVDLSPMPPFEPNSHFDELKEMMQSFDVVKQDEHRAAISEREYWRKLRGDIFLELLRKSPLSKSDIEFLLSITHTALENLYTSDVDFFKCVNEKRDDKKES